MSLGGIGISLGLLLYGYRIIRAIGMKLCKITPARGTVIELSAALVTIFGSRLKIPLSTTHCQIGAICGVGLLESSWNDNVSGINKKILYNIIRMDSNMYLCRYSNGYINGTRDLFTNIIDYYLENCIELLRNLVKSSVVLLTFVVFLRLIFTLLLVIL